MDSTILLQRVAANAPLHQANSLSLVTCQRARRPHVTGAPAAATVIGIGTHLRVELRERVQLAEGKLVVVSWRWREVGEGIGGACIHGA